MTEMTLNETCERVREGLKQAASAARELGLKKGDGSWISIANSFDHYREYILKIAHSKSKVHSEINKDMDRLSCVASKAGSNSNLVN